MRRINNGTSIDKIFASLLFCLTAVEMGLYSYAGDVKTQIMDPSWTNYVEQLTQALNSIIHSPVASRITVCAAVLSDNPKNF